MKTADPWRVAFQALIVAMSTDPRCTPDEQAGLLAMDTILTAAGDTDRQQDALVPFILQRFMADAASNY